MMASELFSSLKEATSKSDDPLDKDTFVGYIKQRVFGANTANTAKKKHTPTEVDMTTKVRGGTGWRFAQGSRLKAQTQA